MTATRNELDDVLRAARQQGRGALIPYITAGYPDPDRFVDVALGALGAGADALEIGVPFSDPLLDGPTIQRSQQRALDLGVTPADCLRFARDIRAGSDKPLLFMGAYNPMLAFGLDRFAAQAAECGLSALIVPDVPFEEQGALQRAADRQGLHVIQLVAPTSTAERIQRVCARASGFVYCISVAGVTGTRGSVVETARPLVNRVRACTDLPVAVGFGISGSDQAREVAGFADVVIVGSAVIGTIEEAGPDARSATERFISSLREALDFPATTRA